MSASFVKNIIIIILLIHFKRINLHMPVVIFRNANIYNIRRRIHQLITWPVTWPLVFDFIQRIIALLEREGKMLPINHTFRRLVKATGKTVRTWQYIYKKVHIVKKNKTLTILFIYKICMIPAKITLQYPFYFASFSPNNYL